MSTTGVSIRRSLLRNLVLLIALSSGAILTLTIVSGQHAVEDLSTTVIDKTARQTETELSHFFAGVREKVEIARGWGERGMLDADDHLAMNALFFPILQNNPQISSMMISEDDGTEYLLLRDAIDPHQWRNRIVRIGEGGGVAYRRFWNTRTGSVRETTEPMDYDTRTRIWYKRALMAQPEVPGKEVVWTKPVIFYVTRDPGFTAATHFVDADGRRVVVAFDLLLLDVARLTAKEVRPSENGTAFVVVEDLDSGTMRLVGLPRDQRFENDEAIRQALRVVDQTDADKPAELPLATSYEIGPVAAAMKAWRADGRREDAIFRFAGPGGDWWGKMRRHDVGQNRFWIGVTLPERDFLARVERERQIVIAVSVLAVVAAVIMAFVLARRYGRPLEQLVRTSEDIRRLELEADVDVRSSVREINALAESQRELMSAMQSFARYVPLEVVRELVKRRQVAQIGGENATLTILFTDVRGFTSISEQMSSQALAEHMAEYFDVMLAELGASGATVDKFVGDAIVAFWGAPTADPDHAEHAVDAVLACSRSLREKNVEWEARGRPVMPTRFGLSTGEVIVGNIGAASRLSYTALGDVVNLAARLEGTNKVYGTEVLASASVVTSAGDRFCWRRIDRVAVKGKTNAVDIYELVGTRDQVSESTVAFAEAYEAVLDQVHAREFAAARSAARQLRDEHPADVSVGRLLAVCERYCSDPPPPSWDGVTRLERK